MPTPTKGRRMGGSSAHQRHMLANLATALFEHGKITTTEARARRLRPVAERLITFAKRGDLHARRQVLTMVTDKDVVHTLFAEIGPSFADPRGRLHPDHQDRPAQGRQRAAGRDRADPRGGGAEAAPPPRPPRAAAPPARSRQGAAEATAEAAETEPERSAAADSADQAEATAEADVQAEDATTAARRG